MTTRCGTATIRAIAFQPWHARYDRGIRTTLAPYPERTLLDCFDDAVRERPSHAALRFKGLSVSLAELDRLSDAFAASLVSLGVTKGDRIAFLLPNCPQFLIAELGAWKAGAIVVAMNPIYTEHELVGPLVETGAEFMVVLTPFYARAKACQARTAVKRIIATNIKEYLPPVTRLLFTLFRERSGGHRVDVRAPDLWMGDLIKAHMGVVRPAVAVGPDDGATILLSGGTTGTPKGVLATHQAYVTAGLQLREWLRDICHDWSDLLMLPLPLCHVYANVGVQGLAFVGHNTMALVPNPRDLDDLLDTINALKPSFFTAVPTLFIALLNHPRVKAGKVDFSSIKVSFSGAAPLLADTKHRFEELTGGRIIEGYSLTEALMACIVNPMRGENKIGSVGLPLPDVEVLIVDATSAAERLPAGEVGEILIRAPQVMAGYWRNADESALALRTHGDGGSWLHTGDLGYLDADGYLFIVDRQKDLIKTSGYQVWPREVEEVLATHPAVAEVGVAGVPDSLKGQAVWAWVVLRAGREATVSELRDHCRASLAPYKIPVQVEFRKELPKTMIGKVLRRQLADEALRALEHQTTV